MEGRETTSVMVPLPEQFIKAPTHVTILLLPTIALQTNCALSVHRKFIVILQEVLLIASFPCSFAAQQFYNLGRLLFN